MNDLTTYAQLREDFNETVRPAVLQRYGDADEVAMREEWNNFTDAACKDGQLTDLEYHWCPSIEEEATAAWPDDDVAMLEEICDCIGLTMSCEWIRERGDGMMESDPPMIHWRCTLKRGDYSMEVLFSMGIAHHPDYRPGTRYTVAIKEDMEKRRDGRGLPHPDLPDVLHSLILDTTGDLDDFSEWCDEYGFDDDSIKARKAFDACREHDRQLSRLLGKYREDLEERAQEL